MTNRSVAGRKRKPKPSKPRKDFPLFAHASGQWAKKVNGKLFYFGVWSDPVAAESKWERDKQALIEGRNPDESRHGDSVGWLLNSLLDEKAAARDRGELTAVTFNDYHRIAKHVAAFFGKARRLSTLEPGDFARYRQSLPATWAPTTINNQLRYVRAIFNYANAIDATPRPINFSRGLAAVSKSNVRKHEATRPRKEFTAAEIWSLHDAANETMRAFILLGLNAAYGTADIGRLQRSDIDLEGQWIGVPRGKTGVDRGCWLWPETVTALRAAIASRPSSTNERLDGFAFLTRDRQPWFVDGSKSNPLTMAFTKLKKQVGIVRAGVGHYALRHVFRTIADGSRDTPAIDYVMGHDDGRMGSLYRESIDQERIVAVCEHVRAWWLAAKPKESAK